MKKTTYDFKNYTFISAVVLLVTTITFAALYVRSNNLLNESLGFGKTCIGSFVKAVDLTLCEEDAMLGNVNITACYGYRDATIDDMKWARSI